MKLLYPDRPVQLKLYSYKAPKFEMAKGRIKLFLYAAADFKVVLKNGKIVDMFSLYLVSFQSVIFF